MVRIHSACSMLFFWLCLAALSTGCADKPKGPEENKAASHLRKILQAFDVAHHKGKHPNDAEELKPFLKMLSKDEEPDEMLRSPNDGEPYEIIWGVRLDRESEGKVLVAHEKKGVDGKRYVINVARIVLQMSEAEFQEATFARGRR